MASVDEQAAYIRYAPKYNKLGNKNGVLGFHGHNADSTQLAPSTMGMPLLVQGVADNGSVVHCPDLSVGAGASSFPAPAITTAIGNAITALQSYLGNANKVNILAWSAGAADFIAAALADSVNVGSKVAKAYLVNPVVDMDWAYALGGYVPAYSTGGVTPPGGWVAELDTLWGGNYNTNVTAPYRIRDQAVAYAALGIETIMSSASDDATLPPAAAGWWVGVANSPNVVLRSPAPIGGHSLGIPTAKEVYNFLNKLT